LTSLPRLGQTDGPWEWLKKAPQIKQLARQSYELVYEWHGAEMWALVPYGGSWDPNYDT
jgi:hypothetical protein